MCVLYTREKFLYNDVFEKRGVKGPDGSRSALWSQFWGTPFGNSCYTQGNQSHSRAKKWGP